MLWHVSFLSRLPPYAHRAAALRLGFVCQRYNKDKIANAVRCNFVLKVILSLLTESFVNLESV